MHAKTQRDGTWAPMERCDNREPDPVGTPFRHGPGQGSAVIAGPAVRDAAVGLGKVDLPHGHKWPFEVFKRGVLRTLLVFDTL